MIKRYNKNIQMKILEGTVQAGDLLKYKKLAYNAVFALFVCNYIYCML